MGPERFLLFLLVCCAGAGGLLIVRMGWSGRVTPGSQLANEVGGLLIVRRGYSGRVTPVSRLANSDLALPW